MVKLQNPALPAHPLYVEYRQPIGFDKGLPLSSAGLFVNEKQDSNTSRLLNANQLRTPSFAQPALMPGRVFSDTARGIRIDSSVVAGGKTSFRATISPPVCTRSTPQLKGVGEIFKDGPGFTVMPGDYAFLQYELTNTDAVSCPASTFTVSGKIANVGSWGTGTVSPDASIILKPGEMTFLTVAYAIPLTAAPAVYTSTLTLSDTQNARTQVSPYSISVLTPAVIDNITPKFAETPDSVTITGSSFGVSRNEISFSNQSNPGNSWLFSAPAQSATTLSFKLPHVCSNLGAVRAEWCTTGELIDLPHGQYSVTVRNLETNQRSNIYLYTVGPDTSSQPLSILTPNGGDQWEIGNMNDVTWSPYSYEPMVNPASDVEAYLERATSTGYKVIGRMIDSGKASLHWAGDVGTTGRYPAPGNNYFVRVKNTKTGEWDRSDAAFTLLPRPVDLKINKSNGPVTLTDNEKITATWAVSNVVSCTLSGIRQTSGGIVSDGVTVSPSSVSQTFYTDAGSAYIMLTCLRSSGEKFSDYVTTNYSAPAVAAASGASAPSVQSSLAITAPNDGKLLPVGKPYTITWEQQGLVSPSIALYQDDKWVKWLAKDIDASSLVWKPSKADAALGTGKVFKVYVTADKLDGTGYLDDKSDTPFGFAGKTASSTSPNPVEAVLGAAANSNELSSLQELLVYMQELVNKLALLKAQ
jgi:hypothetical protein